MRRELGGLQQPPHDGVGPESGVEPRMTVIAIGWFTGAIGTRRAVRWVREQQARGARASNQPRGARQINKQMEMKAAAPPVHCRRPANNNLMAN